MEPLNLDVVSLLVFATTLAICATATFAINRMWWKFTNKIIDDHSKRIGEMNESWAKLASGIMDRNTEMQMAMHDAWEDRVRKAMGLPDRPRGNLVELKTDGKGDKKD